jgi:hypothetical protein
LKAYVRKTNLVLSCAKAVICCTGIRGCRDVERWAGQAATGLQKTYQENVLGPLAKLRDELFKIFR